MNAPNQKPLVIYRDSDADLSHLQGKNVGVIGYGNQGRAQALNLRDSGIPVLVASIRDASAEKAEADGFRVVPIAGCAREADVLLLLIPDEFQRKIYEEFLASELRKGHTLCFAHGYNYHFGLIRPPSEVDVVLVAPRMIGVSVRQFFERGSGVPAYVAVGQDGSGKARQTMLAIARGIGCTRVGAVELSFETETIIDLFLEQTLLPIFTRAMLWSFDVLVEAGVDPQVVALEMYGSGEMAEVFQACADYGFCEQMFRFHSRTAQFGELSRLERMLPDSVRQAMVKGLEDIRSGSFAQEWSQEERLGFPRFQALREAARRHPINSAEEAMFRLLRLGPYKQRGG